MGERRLVGFLLRQVDITAVHGPGERNVEKAQFLGADLFALPLLVLFGAGFFPSKIEGETFLLVLAIVKQQFLLAREFRVSPEEWTKHNRVFQTFALVNGDDLDRVVIALQPQLEAIFRNLLALALLA